MDPFSVSVIVFTVSLILGLLWGVFAIDIFGAKAFFLGIAAGVVNGLFFGFIAYIVLHFVVKFW